MSLGRDGCCAGRRGTGGHRDEEERRERSKLRGEKGEGKRGREGEAKKERR